MAHPGKKLNFMGYEFGQFKEWDYHEGLEFFLRDSYEKHGKLSVMVKDLNEYYKSTAAFYEIEDSWDGFEWLAADDADRNIVSFLRRDKQGNEVIALVSFSGSEATDYLLGVNRKGKYKIIFNTDDLKYGGEGKLKKKTLSAVARPSHGKQYSIPIAMPALTCIYLVKEEEPQKSAAKKSSATKKSGKVPVKKG